MMNEKSWKQRRRNDFENAKTQCLGKRDKSFAGRIDPKAVDVCGIINERDDMYTTSSCAGRCFMYRGLGIKSNKEFTRFRISHDKITDPNRFFDLTTIESDPSGGCGDIIRTVGQYDYKNKNKNKTENENDRLPTNDDGRSSNDVGEVNTPIETEQQSDETIWLRYEPFILHVACRSLSAASNLMSNARPTFKNVGLTTWKDNKLYLVAVWGDDGLEMPLTAPNGVPLTEMSQWLADLVNDRQTRNWNKIQKFCNSLRDMRPVTDDDIDLDRTRILEFDFAAEREMLNGTGIMENWNGSERHPIPKSYDVIGDVAYLHSMPEGDPQNVGRRILEKNKAIKVVVARKSNLKGTERAPGDEGLEIIAGAQRSPLITSHTEFGIRCVVDLNHCFFSPRMCKERLRICQQVARGEDVLVCFAGVGMEAIQISGRTEASFVCAIELNEVAVKCARRGHRMLKNNKAVKCAGAAERLTILEGDVLEILPSLNRQFDRILAPRPKEGRLDGDLGTGECGEIFLSLLLRHLKDGGECHWYDFVADHEFPECIRTKTFIKGLCDKEGIEMDVLHVAHVGSVAKHQIRLCIDFKISRS